MEFSLPNFHCTSSKEKDGCYYFRGKLKPSSFLCPTCRTESVTVHSLYSKTVHDLPISGNNARRFKCKNNECSMIYFTQTSGFTTTGSTKTNRLEELIIDVATHTSLLQATYILRNMGIQTSKSTISRLLKKSTSHH